MGKYRGGVMVPDFKILDEVRRYLQKAAAEIAAAVNRIFLDELQDVVLTAPAPGDVLQFDGTDWVNLPAGSGSGEAWNDFTQDLGVARRSGTFDITGLSGLIAGKVVSIVQTAAVIASKGNARDEFEFDSIALTGYVVDATTIRVYWEADNVVVGTYAFAYIVGA